MDWDDSGDGYLSKHIEDGSVSYPCDLRLKKTDNEFVGEYSTDDGDSWTTLGTATIENANETQDVGIFALSHDRDTKGTVEFSDVEIQRKLETRESVDKPVFDAAEAGDATFDGSGGSYTIEAAGQDVWTDTDEYATVFEPQIDTRDVAAVAETTIESQEDTHEWAKAGIMAANDITTPGSSGGDVIVAATPENGFIMDWDGTGDGYLSEHVEDGSVSYPCKLRLTVAAQSISPTIFTGEYSTDDGETWSKLGEAHVWGANQADFGVFATSHDRGTKGKVEFSDFTVSGTVHDTVDTTAAGNAVHRGYYDQTIEAAGHDVWTDADEYGATYTSESGDFVFEKPVKSQEATHEWAKAGLMVANDITAPGSSAGDLVVAVTPEHGFIMDWDDDGDGYLSKHIEDGSTGSVESLDSSRIVR